MWNLKMVYVIEVESINDDYRVYCGWEAGQKGDVCQRPSIFSYEEKIQRSILQHGEYNLKYAVLLKNSKRMIKSILTTKMVTI
jgi:hypothetical protein